MHRQELTVYRRTLARALEVAGHEANLARFLGLKVADLQDWAAGRADPPFQVFLALIDIVASNTLTPASLMNLQRLAPTPANRLRR